MNLCKEYKLALIAGFFVIVAAIIQRVGGGKSSVLVKNTVQYPRKAENNEDGKYMLISLPSAKKDTSTPEKKNLNKKEANISEKEVVNKNLIINEIGRDVNGTSYVDPKEAIKLVDKLNKSTSNMTIKINTMNGSLGKDGKLLFGRMEKDTIL